MNNRKLPIRFTLEEIAAKVRLGEARLVDWRFKKGALAVYKGRLYHKSWNTQDYIYIGDALPKQEIGER